MDINQKLKQRRIKIDLAKKHRKNKLLKHLKRYNNEENNKHQTTNENNSGFLDKIKNLKNIEHNVNIENKTLAKQDVQDNSVIRNKQYINKKSKNNLSNKKDITEDNR